ncbi:hypothetical protein G7Y89_g4276 [Cudoniella acicularis]|uniref:DUF6594 domain-containing protein n=1 Tax=Cudoniella acicularis TaxID=354080 RepID=A0A8H4RRS2_9HELO|nr:hypothetical protein G7Y89_g4276 [Cudoniella acicularis]
MDLPTGYNKLACFMSSHRYAIFRKFEAIANRDLLYLQAELIALEEERLALAKRDKNTEGDCNLYDCNWEPLSTSKFCSYDSVSRYSVIASKPQARKRDVAMLRDWILRPDLGGGIPFAGADFYPMETSAYQDSHLCDLMTLNNRTGEDDSFSRWLAGPVFHLFEGKVLRYFKVSQPTVQSLYWPHSSHHAQKPFAVDPGNQASQVLETNLFLYSDSYIIGTINILGTIVSSVTPLLSIIILYFISNLAARLGVICGLTILFSSSLALVTDARRIEIFAYLPVSKLFLSEVPRVGGAALEGLTALEDAGMYTNRKSYSNHIADNEIEIEVRPAQQVELADWLASRFVPNLPNVTPNTTQR